jgi:hypothetical protein
MSEKSQIFRRTSGGAIYGVLADSINTMDLDAPFSPTNHGQVEATHCYFDICHHWQASIILLITRHGG